MPKMTAKPHVYKVGQQAGFQLSLTGKVQSIVQKGDSLMVTKVFPFKQPKTKMVAGRQGGGSGPIIGGPIASPDECGGRCADSITYNGYNYKFRKCTLSGSSSSASILC